MVTKAEIEFRKLGSVLYYKVLSQEGIGGRWSHDGVTIASMRIQDIQPGCIYLRGVADIHKENVYASSIGINDDDYARLKNAIKIAAPFIKVHEYEFNIGDVVLSNDDKKPHILCGSRRYVEFENGSGVDALKIEKTNKRADSQFAMCDVFSLHIGSLQWNRCIRTRGGYKIISDGAIIPFSNVLATRNDNFNKFLICNNCGEVIRNTKASIKRHLEKKTSTRFCADCKYLLNRLNQEEKSEVYYVNGVAKQKVIRTFLQKCACSLPYREISEKANGSFCQYAKCTEESLQPVKYNEELHLEREFLTIDDIPAKIGRSKIADYERIHIGQYGEIDVPISCRVEMQAVVCGGIVTNFTFKFRGRRLDIRYVKSEDKFYFLSGNSVTPGDAGYRGICIPDAVSDKIRMIYKHAEMLNKKEKENSHE